MFEVTSDLLIPMKSYKLRRRTSRVFQVIAIEIENEADVRTQCGH